MHQQTTWHYPTPPPKGINLLILVMGPGMVLMGKADVLVDICGIGGLQDYRCLALFL